MPFLDAEDALLEARKASSLMQYVISWFIDGYDVYFKR